MNDGRIRPSHFVLVHGAGHGGWCWYKVRCLLEKSGHKVTCLDLTGAGVDRTDPRSILSFREYNKPLLDFMSGLPEDDKVVLVGHSAGGLSLSQAIHEFSGKITAAIYIAAMMLRFGVTEEFLKAATSSHGHVERTEDGILTEENQRKFLYNTSPEEDQILASMLLRAPPPNPVFLEARFSEGEGSVNVKRFYVKTTFDQISRPELQDLMIELWPPSQVYHLEADHSPFFSAPQQLHDLILQLTYPLLDH